MLPQPNPGFPVSETLEGLNLGPVHVDGRGADGKWHRVGHFASKTDARKAIREAVASGGYAKRDLRIDGQRPLWQRIAIASLALVAFAALSYWLTILVMR